MLSMHETMPPRSVGGVQFLKKSLHTTAVWCVLSSSSNSREWNLFLIVADDDARTDSRRSVPRESKKNRKKRFAVWCPLSVAFIVSKSNSSSDEAMWSGWETSLIPSRPYMRISRVKLDTKLNYIWLLQ